MELDKDFREFIGLLNANEVKYLIVGGYAVVVHGYPRFTGDIDIWVKPEHDNAAKILKVLSDFGFGAVSITLDDLISPDKVIQLGFPPFRIDLLTDVSGLQFDDCYNRKQIANAKDIEVNVIGLQDLRLNKKITGRDKDLLDLKNLPE